VGGDRILAETYTAAVFFGYFFELQQKSNEVSIVAKKGNNTAKIIKFNF
jgi:hypothetical protein